MDNKIIQAWEAALEKAEASPLTAKLPPDAQPGETVSEMGSDGVMRRWIRVEITGGCAGGRWAYWSNKDQHQVVADRIFNGDVAHFVGMLAIPHIGPLPGEPKFFQWVLVSPVPTPPREQVIVDKTEGIRYERSKEVFDVDTQQTRKI